MEPTPTVIGMLGAVLTASLAGSGHCAGMCGAIMAFAVGAGEDGVRTRARAHVAYHAGRLVTYTLLGAAAGALGAVVDLGGSAAGVQRVAAAVAGALMITAGVSMLIKRGASARLHIPVPARWQRLIERGHRLAFTLPPTQRALVIGLLTPMLPCAWLYMFALVAAGSGSPILGAAVMAVFALGTMPVLALLGAGLQTMLAPLRKRMPAITALLIIITGLVSLAGRVNLPVFVTPAMAGNAPADAVEALDRVRSTNPHELPCCNPQTEVAGG